MIRRTNILLGVLSDFYDSTSVPLVGVTLRSVHGETVTQYAESLYNLWKVGPSNAQWNHDSPSGSGESGTHYKISGSEMAQELSPKVLDSIQARVAEAERDSPNSQGMIISAEGIITGFEEDIVVLVDFGGGISA